MQEHNQPIELLRLGMSQELKENYNANKVTFNKSFGRALSEARSKAKKEKCFVCQKEVSSFCNSHSIPQFCLRRIALDGKVFLSGLQDVIPYIGNDTGVKSAGTFQIICHNCDNTIFQEYENPLSYDRIPTEQMLAQIAMKNYLQMIYKRNVEQELYSIYEERFSEKVDFTGSHNAKELDLKEFEDGFKRAKMAANGHHPDWYYLCYYAKLDYVVPIAFQGIVTLVSDFDGNLVNDIYNGSSDYHTQDIHIAVFPFEDKSIVFAFIDSRHKRYRNFYKKLNALNLNDQLAAINYIIFKYSENVFLSKLIPDSVFKDPAFIDVCATTNIAHVALPILNPIPNAIEEYDLSKRNSIPNLLSSEYALT